MLTAKIDPDLHLQADKRALKQIALNLLSNAVKFTPAGGRITVRGRASDHCIALSIADSGIGISGDALSGLGRPFEQVESQLTKSHQGSGLGLAISKSLVELHGGSMRIRSTLGKGTLVVVRLPMQPQCVSAAGGSGVTHPAHSRASGTLDQTHRISLKDLGPCFHGGERGMSPPTAPAPKSARNSRAPSPASRPAWLRAPQSPARRRRVPTVAAGRLRRPWNRRGRPGTAAGSA